MNGDSAQTPEGLYEPQSIDQHHMYVQTLNYSLKWFPLVLTYCVLLLKRKSPEDGMGLELKNIRCFGTVRPFCVGFKCATRLEASSIIFIQHSMGSKIILCPYPYERHRGSGR